MGHFKPSKNSIWRGIKECFWWFMIIDLSLSRVALAHSNGCYSDKKKKLNPQITATIPPGTDQGLLFIQPLFISTDLKPDTMFLLALQIKTDWLYGTSTTSFGFSSPEHFALYREMKISRLSVLGIHCSFCQILNFSPKTFKQHQQIHFVLTYSNL